MALTSVGLTDQGQGPGLTKNFAVAYESTLPNQARVIATANALLSVLESEFTVTIGWFGTDPAKFGPNHRQQVNLNLTGGGNNSGYGTAINVDAQANNPNAADAAARVQMIWMNEWVEILMSLSDGRWNAGNSMGEALSQYCGIVRFQTGHYSYYSSWVQQWLDTHPRQNFIDNTEPTDKNAISFGCGLAFLYYLTTQLGYDIRSVIAAGAPTFADVHAKLTGDHASPYVRFAALLERAYPSNLTVAIRGPVTDDPFPIAPVGRGRTAIHPRSDEGAVSLYAAGLDGRVWSAYWPAAGSTNWSGWYPIGTNTFVTGAPITAIHPRSDEGAVSLVRRRPGRPGLVGLLAQGRRLHRLVRLVPDRHQHLRHRSADQRHPPAQRRRSRQPLRRRPGRPGLVGLLARQQAPPTGPAGSRSAPTPSSPERRSPPSTRAATREPSASTPPAWTAGSGRPTGPQQAPPTGPAGSRSAPTPSSPERRSPPSTRVATREPSASTPPAWTAGSGRPSGPRPPARATGPAGSRSAPTPSSPERRSAPSTRAATKEPSASTPPAWTAGSGRPTGPQQAPPTGPAGIPSAPTPSSPERRSPPSTRAATREPSASTPPAWTAGSGRPTGPQQAPPTGPAGSRSAPTPSSRADLFVGRPAGTVPRDGSKEDRRR